MAENKILPWAQTGTANVLSDADYAADVASGGLYGDGVKTGQASSKQANKTWRQATAPGSGLGQFLVDNLGVDVTDADTPATFSTRIANAVLKLAQVSPFNQAWASATGGYRKYAIVSDSSGNFWVSTADQNTTTPGASGANWQNLFNGYATQSWVDGLYVKSSNDSTNIRIDSAGINKQTGMPWVHTGSGYTNLQPAGDYATNTALQAETQRAANIESNLQSSKANLSGGNSFTGNQSVSGAVASSSHSGSDAQGGLRWGGYLNSAITGSVANGNIYLAEIVGSDVYYDMQINYGSSRTDFTFHQNGSIESPKGTVAFQSDLSNYVSLSTYQNDFSTFDSRVINLAYGHRIQCFTATVYGSSQTVSFPTANSSTVVVLASCSLQPGYTNRAGLVQVNSWDGSSCNVTTFFMDAPDLSFATAGLPCYFIVIGEK